MRNRNPWRDIRAGHGGGARRVRDKYDGGIIGTPSPDVPTPAGDNVLFIEADSFLIDADGTPFLWSP